ncbi:hypothetical protein AeNC1_015728 [Aphanomyces euteiches]|nr:hypothetical protein AeNC1_015728 [Aphanomyces euteiches]
MQAAAGTAGVTSIAVVHGDKSQEDRTMHLNRFKNGSALLLFATDVASRGLHVNDVACVINVDCPPNEETYIHRIGRTGRAGAKGQAITLVSPKDVGMVKTLLRVVREAGQSVPDDVLAWIQQQKQAKLPLENEEQQRKRGRDDAKTEPNRAKKSKKATPPPPPQKKKQKKKVGKRKQRLCQ